MATVRQYYDADFRDFIGPEGPMPLETTEGIKLSPPVMWKLLLGYDSRASFFVFYVPGGHGSGNAAMAAIDNFDWVLQFKKDLRIQEGFYQESLHSLDDCVFTGRVILYVEEDLIDADKRMLEARGRSRNLAIVVRDRAYMRQRESRMKPIAFIAHDSRDKDQIARPLATSVNQNLCRVWFDEFSLNVGDSLRDHIEKGLKECKRCILILTPNFLSNAGWPKREFDSIFTREILDKQDIVLPIWSNVSVRDVYEYSPSLANRLGIDWALGVEEVTRRLLKVVL
jgi:hypothetical protein